MKRLRAYRNAWLVIAAIVLPALCGPAPAAGQDTVTINPQEYEKALKNPLKGFRARAYDGKHPYSTLKRMYLEWNELERNAGDGPERIRAVCDRMWQGIEKHNIKIIPRVYLHWPKDRNYWPDDMKTGDYTSDQFKRRVVRLVRHLGECWNDDPRVAWVQMGIIGAWGEHHAPSPSPEMQKLLGDAFTKAFPDKMVTVRHPWEFKDYEVGIYWDSWAHIRQMKNHGAGIGKLGDRWKARPMAGEVAYNWGPYKQQPGDDPSDTLRDPKHRNHLLDTIRRWHCNNLGWVAEYDRSDPKVRAGAEQVQKAFGYRFVIDQVEYPAYLVSGRAFTVRFKVRNDGSSPFYEDWPVELSLLDSRTRQVVWREPFKDVDIRQWLPGDDWDADKRAYSQPPKTYTVEGQFRLPGGARRGHYVLALAILDPAGNVPSARFAIRNYFKGGRHPIGGVGIGTTLPDPQIDPGFFDDPADDNTLHYVVERR